MSVIHPDTLGIRWNRDRSIPGLRIRVRFRRRDTGEARRLPEGDPRLGPYESYAAMWRRRRRRRRGRRSTVGPCLADTGVTRAVAGDRPWGRAADITQHRRRGITRPPSPWNTAATTMTRTTISGSYVRDTDDDNLITSLTMAPPSIRARTSVGPLIRHTDCTDCTIHGEPLSLFRFSCALSLSLSLIPRLSVRSFPSLLGLDSFFSSRRHFPSLRTSVRRNFNLFLCAISMSREIITCS